MESSRLRNQFLKKQYGFFKEYTAAHETEFQHAIQFFSEEARHAANRLIEQMRSTMHKSPVMEPEPILHSDSSIILLKEAAKAAMRFIESFPIICTQEKNPIFNDSISKALRLKKLEREGQLIVHYDDHPVFIEEIRKETPSVLVVQVHRRGTFPPDLGVIVRDWYFLPEYERTNNDASQDPLFDALDCNTFRPV